MEFLRNNRTTEVPRLDSVRPLEKHYSVILPTVSHSSFVYKTASAGKLLQDRRAREEFSRRWCVLSDGVLSYYENERAVTPNGEIRASEIVCLAVPTPDTHGFEHTFEVYTEGERLYLFGLESAELAREWVKCIAKAFVPPLAEDLLARDFERLGRLPYKAGLSLQRAQEGWFALTGSELYAVFPEGPCEEPLQLRKLQELSVQGDNENQVLVLVERRRTLYIQGERRLDFMGWLGAIQKAAASSGDTLSEQQLGDSDIPVIVYRCVDYITQCGLTSEGIYRKCGQTSKTLRLLESLRLDARSVRLKEGEQHVDDVSSALKRFLRDLPDGLFTRVQRLAWLEASEIEDEEEKVSRYRELLARLPPVNRATVKALISHLYCVQCFSDTNQMNTHNLAIVFGPTLFQTDGQDYKAGRVVEDLINHYVVVFSVDEEELRKQREEVTAIVKMRVAGTASGTQHAGDFICTVYLEEKKAEAEQHVKIPASMTAEELTLEILDRRNVGIREKDYWTCFEVNEREEAERPLHFAEKVLPILHGLGTDSYLVVKKHQSMEAMLLYLASHVGETKGVGQHAVLSGRRFLYIVNLDAPFEGHRKISRQSKWDIGAVQWNPHDSFAHYFAASSNQRVDLYKWKDGSGEVGTTLHGHTRVVSDLDWAVFEPDLLVTSSVDTYIYIWDIKDTRKPTVALSAVAGASQVKWNKKNANCLATSHDGDVRIWDKRKPSTAVEYLAAHLSKIHGLDWHPDSEHILATSSQDNSVKFWDYRQPRKYLNILPCQVPVWKARYTPFSNGLVTVMVPQLRRENSLLLWNVFDLNTPVHTFVGHDDVVLEFQWRKQKEGSKDYQLVTWSRDQTLRMWRVDSQMQRLCANDILDGVDEFIDSIALLPEPEKILHTQDTDHQHNSSHGEEEVLKEDPLSSLLEEKKSEQLGLPQTLQQEFSLINVQIRNVNVEMDAADRSCTVSVHCSSHRVKMLVKFPAQYPNHAAPSFQFINPTTITSTMKAKLLKILKDTSLQKVKRNQSCLEPCLRQLVSCLESFVNQEDSASSNPFALPNSVTPPLPTFARVTTAYGSYQDANIPFPRTSGARFCGAGYLVYFTRPMTMHRAVSPTEPTPRSLSALSAYHTGLIAPMKIRTEAPGNLRLYSGSPTRSEKEQVSISSFYYKERKSRRWKSKREGSDSGNRPIKAAGKVIIQDIACLLPVHKSLGELYILNVNDIQETCQKNAASALLVGRKDLVQVWSLATVATDLCLGPKSDPDLETPWARHPFGRQLLESLLAHYCRLRDVQTLAMLCSVFEAQSRPQGAPNPFGPFPSRSANLVVSHSRYPSFTSSGSCSSLSDPGFNTGGWNIVGRETEHLSSPWGESSPEEIRFGSLTYSDPRERERDQHDKNKRLLDPANTQQFDDFKKCYGEILYRWGLREKRAEVLKFVSCPPDPHKGIEFGVYCSHCRSEVRGTQCAICKGFTFQCAICHVAVRGSSNFCLTCGHGGHTSHMMEWFRTQEVCPTGCGCHCLLESTF